jgi:hypothetical protein
MKSLLPDGKDESVLIFLRALAGHVGGWEVGDHWEGDRAAIGVVSRRDPSRLAYVSSWEQPAGCYIVELEENAGSDGYDVAGRVDGCSLTDAVAAVAVHLFTATGRSLSGQSATRRLDDDGQGSGDG